MRRNAALCGTPSGDRMPLLQTVDGRRVVSEHPPQRLDSWKDIAAYLKRDVSTVQRWEKREGMPVHRHQHDKLGSVYAFTSELDAWARSRRTVAEPVDQPPAVVPSRRTRKAIAVAAAIVIATVIAGIVIAMLQQPQRNPLAEARFVRLTDFDGMEHAVAISRDGRFVAFLSDREGPVDVWVTQIGSGQFVNLSRGKLRELVNPDIRTLTFTPDGASVLVWVRRQTPAGSPDISLWSIPTLGGEPRLFLEGAAEVEWSSDGRRLVYHTPAPGDPMFVRDAAGSNARRIFSGAEGVHNHYQVWSPDDRFIYFVHGPVPSVNEAWRIAPSGGAPQRMTSHNTRVTHLSFLDDGTLLYLANESDGDGPWLYGLDVESGESRRISFGVERYTSLAASADGRRLVVSVANARRTLWRVPIGPTVAEAKDAARVTVPIVGGRAPAVGPDYLLYVSSRSNAESIWKLTGGSAAELWNVTGGRVIGRPSITRDGKRIAFTAEEGGRTRLHVMNADGSGARTLAESLHPRGAPAWSPDGTSIAVAAGTEDAPRLARVSFADGLVTTVLADFASDPVWSQDGETVVFSGREVGTTFPIRTVSLDGQLQSLPDIKLSRGVRRIAFLPGENALVVLRGDMIHKNFWAIDLSTGAERRLTNFGPDFMIGDFDVSPDGREIVFDREQDDSDVVLIER